MKKELQVAKTLIGNTLMNYNGHSLQFFVYYGNYLVAENSDIQKEIERTGQYIQQKPADYMNLLLDFLKSDKGQEYRFPTKDEVTSAVNEVLTMEFERMPKKEVNPEVPKELIEEETKDVVTEKPKPVYIYEEDAPEEEPVKEKDKKNHIKKTNLDELTLMYKRQANILTIAVIFLVLVVALQMLLNLYLLTR